MEVSFRKPQAEGPPGHGRRNAVPLTASKIPQQVWEGGNSSDLACTAPPSPGSRAKQRWEGTAGRHTQEPQKGPRIPLIAGDPTGDLIPAPGQNAGRGVHPRQGAPQTLPGTLCDLCLPSGSKPASENSEPCPPTWGAGCVSRHPFQKPSAGLVRRWSADAVSTDPPPAPRLRLASLWRSGPEPAVSLVCLRRVYLTQDEPTPQVTTPTAPAAGTPAPSAEVHALTCRPLRHTSLKGNPFAA